VNSLPAQTFSTINSIVVNTFSYSAITVTFFSLTFSILHPLCAPPANWILDKLGMRIGCTLGAGLVICGVWLRVGIIQGNPGFVIAGTIISAMGNVFILNSPTILANNWFSASEMPGIISIAVLSNMVSIILGSCIPGFVIHESENVAKNIQNFLIGEACVISAGLLPLILFLRDKPPNPPSMTTD
jgi:hypothetical protein